MFIILKHFFVILFETQNIWQKKKQTEISYVQNPICFESCAEFGDEICFFTFLD